MDARVGFEPFYAVPYQRSERTDPGRVLIVGAGTGTDVALALRQGATSVDAVEIDPRIREIGQDINPNRPFDDPRVTVHINDGRAFIEQADGPYDTILFALPDSLTLVAGASQLRLESYLFTEPAMQRVSELLADDGVFAMYNYYREPWLVGRLGATMASAFGHAPCIDLNRDYNSAVLVVSADESMQRCSAEDESAALIAGAPAPVDDNRPFLYLRTPHIPGFYLAVLAMILGISLVAVRGAVGSLRRTRRYADLFLLGAAFLLLETRAITMFALLFGTTWLVNAIVFGGILVAVLAAVEFTAWMKRTGRSDRISLPIAYAVLLASLAARVAGPACVAAAAARAAADHRGLCPHVHAGVHRERGVRLAVRRGARAVDRVRDQPAGRDARRGAGVPRPADRLPRAAARGRGAVRGGAGAGHARPAPGRGGSRLIRRWQRRPPERPATAGWSGDDRSVARATR